MNYRIVSQNNYCPLHINNNRSILLTLIHEKSMIFVKEMDNLLILSLGYIIL